MKKCQSRKQKKLDWYEKNLREILKLDAEEKRILKQKTKGKKLKGEK